MASLGFRLNAKEAMAKGGALPDDWYLLNVVSSEVKTAQSGNDYLLVNYQVVAGEYEGANVSMNYNHAHEKTQTREWALADLGSLTNACERDDVEDLDEIIGIPFYAHVTVQAAKPYVDAKTGEEKQGFERNSIARGGYMSVADFDRKHGGVTQAQVEQRDHSTARSTPNGGAGARQDERPLSQRAAASGPAGFAGKSRPWGGARA